MGAYTRKVVARAAAQASKTAFEGARVAEAKNPAAWRWFTRGLIMLTLVAGWIFILAQNKFHVDAPVVVVMLAFFAVVMTVANLWRIGATIVTVDDPVDDSWGRPLGERGELEREKKTLLKSIKEAEFDQAMGKLSKKDADELIAMYRARAIEVIKELERVDAGAAQTPRAQIEREVAARLHVDERTKGDKKLKGKNAKADKAKRSMRDEATKAERATKADRTSDAGDAGEPASTTTSGSATTSRHEVAATSGSGTSGSARPASDDAGDSDADAGDGEADDDDDDAGDDAMRADVRGAGKGAGAGAGAVKNSSKIATEEAS